MKNFWGYYDNGIYRVGCSGGTIYIYNQDDEELAKFKNMRYTYSGMFKPNANVFVAKSTDGVIAVYDLDKLELVKKITVDRQIPQDEGFAFSLGGMYFYNIEQIKDGLRTQLTKYDASDFHVVETLFADREKMFLEGIEFDDETEECYILGYMRGEEDIYEYGFVGQLMENEIVSVKKIEEDVYHYARNYKGWERSGFTKKKFQWSNQSLRREKCVSLKGLFRER